MLTASVNVKLWYLRSSRTVFIHIIRGHPDGFFLSSSGDAVVVQLGLTSHSTYYIGYFRDDFTGHMTQPIASRH